VADAEVALTAPGGGAELGLGQAAEPPSAGVVDRGAVLVELAASWQIAAVTGSRMPRWRSRAVKVASLLERNGSRPRSSWALP
jgi:hypothetical protein